MDVSELYQLYRQYPVVTTDSRCCPAGSLFFALKGDSFDGNAFAESALRAGCAYAVVDDASVATNERIILVDDVLTALQQLARLHRQTLGTTIIGVTGTNGKTTTKELIAAVLSKKYRTLYTQGNLNNHIGVPLTLLRLTPQHEIGVIEMGANHCGEIRDLSAIACPDYGLITNVGEAHLEGFGSLAGVLKTKSELYDYLRARPDGKIFINRDDKLLAGVAGNLDRIAYGKMALPDEDMPFVGGEVSARHPTLSFAWRLCGGSCGGEVARAVTTQLVGDYNLWNALAAIAIGVYFGVPHAQIDEAIAEYHPSNNRSQLQKTPYNMLIIDAYNANPSSMRAAIENFASSEASPKAVILGDMLELGRESPALHAAVVGLLNECDFEKVLLCGKHFTAVGQQYACFPDITALNAYLETKPLRGYNILVKGSHGIHLEKIIERL